MPVTAAECGTWARAYVVSSAGLLQGASAAAAGRACASCGGLRCLEGADRVACTCRAAAYIKLGDPASAALAVDDASTVLGQQRGNAKALYRRGQARVLLKVRPRPAGGVTWPWEVLLRSGLGLPLAQGQPRPCRRLETTAAGEHGCYLWP